MGYAQIREKLTSGTPVILDGGMGSEVIRRGVRWRRHGLEDAPGVIRQIHEDYLMAGSDVISTHTFDLTKRNFINFFRDADHMAEIGAPGLETKAGELCRQAVLLAKEALRQTATRGRSSLAGSISPVDHPFRPDLSPDADECYAHHTECVQVLADAGVDLIFFEAMNNIREVQAAIRAAKTADLPIWVSLIPDHKGNLLNGESLSEASALFRADGVEAVLLGWAPPDDISNSLSSILNGGASGAHAMVGRYNPPSWKPDFYPRFADTDQTSPSEYAKFAAGWLAAGAAIVGGSSGTTPEHITAVKKTVG